MCGCASAISTVRRSVSMDEIAPTETIAPTPAASARWSTPVKSASSLRSARWQWVSMIEFIRSRAGFVWMRARCKDTHRSGRWLSHADAGSSAPTIVARRFSVSPGPHHWARNSDHQQPSDGAVSASGGAAERHFAAGARLYLATVAALGAHREFHLLAGVVRDLRK